MRHSRVVHGVLVTRRSRGRYSRVIENESEFFSCLTQSLDSEAPISSALGRWVGQDPPQYDSCDDVLRYEALDYDGAPQKRKSAMEGTRSSVVCPYREACGGGRDA
eukprot:4463516-Pyramimonas_sp.AAC.1